MSALPKSSGSDHGSRSSSLILFFLLGVVPLYWYATKGEIPFIKAWTSQRAVAAIAGSSDWYMTLKIPEAPRTAEDVALYQTRMKEWLDGIDREGFHPMLLSDVYGAIRKGTGLPDKTIVLVFEPGYNHTYQAIEPLLVSRKTPIVWVTNPAAIKRSDRKYVSNFRLWRMRRSGFIDIGSYLNNNQLLLETKDHPNTILGTEKEPTWSPKPVSQALNRGNQLASLNRLKVSPQWTSQELVARLKNEVPLEGTSQLTTQVIGERQWGISIPGGSYTGSLISVQAPMNRRDVTISWPSTKPYPHFDLQMDVASSVGEMWLLLRSNREKNESIRVGFTSTAILVDLDRGGRRERLSRSSIAPHRGPFSAGIALQDQELKITYNGNLILRTESLPNSAANSAMVELLIYNRIRGTASADGVRLIYTPHTHTSQKTEN